MSGNFKSFLIFLALLSATIQWNAGNETLRSEDNNGDEGPSPSRAKREVDSGTIPPDVQTPKDNTEIDWNSNLYERRTNNPFTAADQDIVTENEKTDDLRSQNTGSDTGNQETGLSASIHNGTDTRNQKTDILGFESDVKTETSDMNFGNFGDLIDEESSGYIESLMHRTNLDSLDISSYYQCQRSSCNGRCHNPVIEGTNCRCDERCLIFGDCCYDYFSLCRGHILSTLLNPAKTKSDVSIIVKQVLGEESYIDVHTNMYLYGKCQSLNNKYAFHHYWMLSTCTHGSDEDLQARCNDDLSDPLAKVPVSLASKPDLVFKNVFCALCNGVKKEELLVWSTSATCPGIEKDVTYDEFMRLLQSSQCVLDSKAPPEARYCTHSSDDINLCPIDETNIDLKSLSCRSYVYHVFNENSKRFPNWHCGSCSNKGSIVNTSFVCELKPDTFNFNGLEMTVCEGRSCEGRCGRLSRSESDCSCDSDCLLFGDCCYDFIPVCLNETFTLTDLSGDESLIYTLTEMSLITTTNQTYDNETSRNLNDSRVARIALVMDKNDIDMNNEDFSELKKLKMLFVKYKTCHVHPNDDKFWVIGQCPKGHELLPCYESDPTNRSLIAPVSVRSQPTIVFKNIFCAFCHGMRPETLITWQTYISCDPPVDSFESEESLLRSEKCSLNTYQQKGTRPCFKFDVEENQDPAPVSQELCQAYNYPIYRGDVLVRNPHCDKDVKQIGWPTCLPVYGKAGSLIPEHESRPSGLSILFNFKDGGLSFTSSVSGTELRPTVLCQEDEVYDDRNKICKRLHCQNGKIAMNGTCVSNGIWLATEEYFIFPNGSTMYVLEIYFMADELIRVSDTETDELNKEIEFYFKSESIVINPVSSLPSLLQGGLNHHNITQALTIELAINSGHLENHLSIIFEMTRKLLEPKGIQIISIYLRNYVDDDKLKCSFGAVSRLDNAVTSQLDGILYANETDKLYPLNSIPFILDISNEVPVLHEASVCEIPLDCDPIAYNLTDFDPEDGALQSKHSNLVLSNGTYFISGELVYYCHNFTRGPFRRGVPFFQFDPVQDILSYISSAISLTSLAVTLVVYMLFPQLRNLPGRLTMSLSVSLFLAQGLLLFIHLPKGIFCNALAISLHYLWLCTFMWMTAMSINVARTFTNQLKGHVESIAVAYLKHAICALGIPALIVLLSTLMEYLDIQDVEIGYGKHGVCWIANPRASLLSFGVPLALMLLVNLVTFILTFYNIEKAMQSSQKISSTQKDRNKVLIYCKLFVIMGLSWGFSFAAAFADIAALWYIFIVLNGLQGFYIFISFICTERVKLFLKKKLTGQGSEFSQSKTQSSNLSKI